MSSSSSFPAAAEEEELTLTVKWSGKDYTVRVRRDDSIGELKRRICQLTNVLPKRQKLLYPKVMGSRLSNDAILLSEFPLKSSIKMTMIGYFEIGCSFVGSNTFLADFGQGLNSGVSSIRGWREGIPTIRWD